MPAAFKGGCGLVGVSRQQGQGCRGRPQGDNKPQRAPGSTGTLPGGLVQATPDSRGQSIWGRPLLSSSLPPSGASDECFSLVAQMKGI